VLALAGIAVLRYTDPVRPWRGAVVMTGTALAVTTPWISWYSMLLVALVALALLGLARPAAAQNPASAPSPGAILVAKQIVELKGARQMFTPLVRGVVEKVKDQFMQTNFMWAKDLNEIAANLQKDYAPRASELVDMTAKIYAEHFTEAELKALLTFYQSPLGRKMIVEEPKVVDESLTRAGQWGDLLAEDVVAKMRAEMKKRGHDI